MKAFLVTGPDAAGVEDVELMIAAPVDVVVAGERPEGAGPKIHVGIGAEAAKESAT